MNIATASLGDLNAEALRLAREKRTAAPKEAEKIVASLDAIDAEIAKRKREAERNAELDRQDAEKAERLRTHEWWERQAQACEQFPAELAAAVKDCAAIDDLVDKLAACLKSALDHADALAQNARKVKPRLEHFDLGGAHHRLTHALLNRIAGHGLPIRYSFDKDKETVGEAMQTIGENLIGEARLAFKKNWPAGEPPKE